MFDIKENEKFLSLLKNLLYITHLCSFFKKVRHMVCICLLVFTFGASECLWFLLGFFLSILCYNFDLGI